MKTSSNLDGSIIGGYFPLGESLAELSVEFDDTAPLTIAIQVKAQGKLQITGANRTVSWAELRFARGLLAVKTRYERDKVLERLTAKSCQIPLTQSSADIIELSSEDRR